LRVLTEVPLAECEEVARRVADIILGGVQAARSLRAGAC
jgi:hypothetical protein